MKKILFLMITCLLITGCTVVRIDTDSIANITGVILEKDNSLYNHVGKGYKYYIPKGVTYIDTIGLNDMLYSNGNYYYLYIDAPGYINNIEPVYEEDSNLYYSKKIDINGKIGYLEIKEVDKQYLIKFVYNYASFEALVDEKNINEVVTNASYILSTVKYNDKVIALMLNSDYFTNREEQYKEFTSKKSSGNFLKAPDENIETME
ncbi:MAG: hypothetical protein IJ565_04365 [Bacilli bacterium]|nr:hypothetical protein [Bacilli bacterium]